MRKTYRMKTLVVIVCICMLMMSGTVFAANETFSFTFNNLNNQTTSSYTKSDSDQKWYISLDNIGSNNMSSSNIFGCKMNRTSNNNVDIYHTFSSYVNSYAIKYTSTVVKDDSMYMGAKKDSASTSKQPLKISGRLAP